MALIRQRDVLKSIHSIQQLKKNKLLINKVLFKILGYIREQIIKSLSIKSLVGALFAMSCLLQVLIEEL